MIEFHNILVLKALLRNITLVVTLERLHSCRFIFSTVTNGDQERRLPELVYLEVYCILAKGRCCSQLIGYSEIRSPLNFMLKLHWGFPKVKELLSVLTTEASWQIFIPVGHKQNCTQHIG